MYTKFQEQVDAYVRDHFFRDYPEVINDVLERFEVRPEEVAGEIRDQLNIHLGRESFSEIIEVVQNVFNEEIEE
jgi:hypothetical protein